MERTSWIAALLLALLPVAGCDAHGSGSGKGWAGGWEAHATVDGPGSTSSPSPSSPAGPEVVDLLATATPSVVHNVAVPPGRRGDRLAVHHARADRPNPKLREAVVRGAREARAAAEAEKRGGPAASASTAAKGGPMAKLPAKAPTPRTEPRAAPKAAPRIEPRVTVEPTVQPTTPAEVADRSTHGGFTAPAGATEGPSGVVGAAPLPWETSRATSERGAWVVPAGLVIGVLGVAALAGTGGGRRRVR